MSNSSAEVCFTAPQSAEPRGILSDAVGYWERRRIIYNLLLSTLNGLSAN